MRRLVFVLVAGLLSVLAAGCAELDEFDAGLQEYTDELHASSETSERPLTDSQEPQLEAAGRSSEYTNALVDADTYLDRALESKDYRDLDKAIESRPHDASYVAYRAALIWAEQSPVEEPVGNGAVRQIQADDAAFDTAARAKGLVLARGGSAESFYVLMLDTLLTTMSRYTEGSDQWGRLNFRFCATLGAFERELGRTATSLFYTSLIGGCGSLLAP